MLTRNWATKLEYRYSQFGTQNISGISITPSTHALRAGLSYKFGGFGGAPSEDGPVFNEPAFNWTGFYGGVAAGAGMATGPVTASAGGASATSPAPARACWAVSSLARIISSRARRWSA